MSWIVATVKVGMYLLSIVALMAAFVFASIFGPFILLAILFVALVKQYHKEQKEKSE